MSSSFFFKDIETGNYQTSTIVILLFFNFSKLIQTLRVLESCSFFFVLVFCVGRED